MYSCITALQMHCWQHSGFVFVSWDGLATDFLLFSIHDFVFGRLFLLGHVGGGKVGDFHILFFKRRSFNANQRQEFEKGLQKDPTSNTGQQAVGNRICQRHDNDRQLFQNKKLLQK